jgi:voltage-gated potassium channel
MNQPRRIRKASTPLRKIRVGAVILVAILVLSTVGYRVWGNWSWLDSFYMVAITVSTVGYREVGELDQTLKILTIVLIVFGISAAIYTIGGFIQMMTEGEIERALGVRRLTRDIGKLSNHVIVCGFGRMGHILTDEMTRRNKTFVVIDLDPVPVADLVSQGHLAIQGDATEEDVLLEAGVERARSLVTALPSDAANVFITLTSRNLNSEMQIIARGEFPSTQKKLIQAGANRVVLPAAIGAQRIANMITRPSIVELMELVAGSSTLDVEVDELRVPGESRLIDSSVMEAETRRRHKLLLVAIKRSEGDIVFNPDPDTVFKPNDTIIVMGRAEDIERFRIEFSI